ncbi:hypothetical protein CCP2SC5_1350007 [Azospirillaceae bacterium]
METLLHLPPWQGHLIVGVVLSYAICMAGWVTARAGRSPLWAMALLVPYVNVLALWCFAYCRWPAMHVAPNEVSNGDLNQE